ncbi:hypothetical protein [Nitratifractor sp.]
MENPEFQEKEGLPRRVILAGLEIPFWDLVWFMVKFALASIPAMLILYLFFLAIGMLFAGCGNLVMPGSMP